jgi:hypothetical protein
MPRTDEEIVKQLLKQMPERVLGTVVESSPRVIASGASDFLTQLKENQKEQTKASGGSVMGINVASDRKAGRSYADLIVDGHKTLESRNGDSLRPYVGKRVSIVRTGEGKAKAIGEVTIGEPMVVNSKQFRELEHKHLVPKGSAYDISTPTKHLYPLHDPVRYDQEREVGHGIVARKVMQKASGGSIPSMDVMRLAIGGQGPKNWLKGSVEQVIKPLKSAYDPDSALEDLRQLREKHGELPAYAQDEQTILHAKAINQWIERNLANYIKKQMATHDDPIRKLAEQGIIHFSPEMAEENQEHADYIRKLNDAPRLGQSQDAKNWEDLSDSTMHINTLGELKESAQKRPDVYGHLVEPWMDKVNPDTKIFRPSTSMTSRLLGFDHLVDILKEDLAQGRIRPEQLSKVSIEQAVRRAHEYDQERKKAMAETALKATEGMPVHKDYGDGFKWIELALPKDMPEGWTERNGAYYDPTGERHVHPGMGKLADALKYEGDTMGHCVGGYCPDVAEGRSRIFSLRDAKNEPHVTIEVQPMRGSELGRYAAGLPEGEDVEAMKNPPHRIVQIKGKGNAKPKSDYIPYVQDFVKSGNWSDIGDFHNTDLIRQDGKLMNKNEYADWMLGQLKPDQKADGGEVDAEEVFMGPKKVTHAHHLEIEERKL